MRECYVEATRLPSKACTPWLATVGRLSLPGYGHFTPSLGNAFAVTASKRVRGKVLVASQTQSTRNAASLAHGRNATQASHSTTVMPWALGASLKTFTRCHFGSHRRQRRKPIAPAGAFNPLSRGGGHFDLYTWTRRTVIGGPVATRMAYKSRSVCCAGQRRRQRLRLGDGRDFAAWRA